MKILITGAAGFIGFHLTRSLLSHNISVVGIDNINDYYDVNLKFGRLKELGINKSDASVEHKKCKGEIHGDKFIFIKMNLEDRERLPKLFTKYKFDIVCNLAAQAGVRYSIENPSVYIDSNIVGFLNLLECCKNNKIKKLIYASSSSVYGNLEKTPFKESFNVDNPISIYAATKKTNELLAYTYTHLNKFETIGLRFFTVYGPWGRPDMALFLFTEAIINEKYINVFNNGELSRDFTYIDDIIEGVENIIFNESKKNKKMYKLYNIGNNKPVKLLDFIDMLEKKLKKTAKKRFLPMQQGDVYKTWADVSKLKEDFDFESKTKIDEGIEKFISWYLKYYKSVK